MNNIKKVTDESGAVHHLLKKIGVGGQGEVWLVKGGRRIVKLLNSQGHAETLRRQFAFVRRLDLNGLHVAKPIAVLKPPHVGYVAEFLDDMVPINILFDHSSSALELLDWHIKTGGLRRRLRLLAHAGEALMGLHARGVIYADVSDNNVFISEPVTANEAWLIDLDNLSHTSDPRHAIYTPSYGAPEIVAGNHGCTSLSDAWAFAVLVWRTLTLGHPFIGDDVSDGEPELEEEAYAGRLSWVGHSTDDSNRCSTGLPSELTLTVKLKELARKTFEEGLNDRKQRTSVSDWVEHLHAAADQTVTCLECSGSYFVAEDKCPWCDEVHPSFIDTQIAHWQPNEGLIKGIIHPGMLPLTEAGLVLTRRVTEGLSGLAAREAHVEIMPVSQGLSVRAISNHRVWVAPVDGTPEECVEVSGRGRIIPSSGWMIFFNETSRPQRVLIFVDANLSGVTSFNSPHVSCVTKFLEGMVPIKTLLDAPSSDFLEWYFETGGLRRRLRLLAHAGEALMELYTRGVVYNGVSENNVFISESVAATEVCLIEFDDLSHISDLHHAAYTPGYAAPEVVAGNGGRTLYSDAWAFAVLVWNTLTLNHPFIGDFVSDRGPELEEEAYAGGLPWIEHSTDKINHCTVGLSSDLTLAKRLKELARKTFEEGLEDPKQRTSVSDWVKRLHTAADQTVTCPECSISYFVIEKTCPWCDEVRPSITAVQIFDWRPDGGFVGGRGCFGKLPLTEAGLVLTRRVTEGLTGPAAHDAHVEIVPKNQRLFVRAVSNHRVWVAPASASRAPKEYLEVSGCGRMIPSSGWMLFFDEPSKPQRVLLLGGSNESR